ncbi:hypothetical protein TW81_14945 [Vibrio galatheae]|uniref:SIR2-like domain-containing protein n=1 Tax=Vibrio galatheae TaxID=579748 RepID=A0A0F4NH17_9VIBR|nr:tetratricopeptide repeat protein [Vibrio galatheae]KJY82138.1 hypothetical protein TW81_14945 [Vibrio galatheae]
MGKEQEWSLNGFLDELKRIHETMPDRRFVFILGAGASIESKVKGAARLATEWMKIIFRRSQNGEESNYLEWLKNNPLDIEDWDYDNLATHYPQIFSCCFEGDHESGYAELEKAIEQGSPSFGYAVLAWILAQDRHNMVVTTNFDNLVADSMYIYGGKTPLVIGHESLASYLKPMSRRPMIAKIHRDLFTDPINDEDGVGELKTDWVDALKSIFRFYTPVFIGYGGNDGSLMNFLNSLATNDISGRPFWCYYEPDGKPNGDIPTLMDKHQGVLVATPGFDQLMFEIGKVWGYNRHDQKSLVARNTQKMLSTLDQETLKLFKESSDGIREKLQEDGSATGVKRDWVDWQIRIDQEQDKDKITSMYKNAINNLPNSYELHNNFANHLKELKDYELAFEHYQSAMKLTNDIIPMVNLAELFAEQGKLEEAENYYLKSLEKNSNDDCANNNYANFLIKNGRYLEAEPYILKAIEHSNTEPEDFRIYLETYIEFLLESQNLVLATTQLKKLEKLAPLSKEGIQLKERLATEQNDLEETLKKIEL